MRRVSLERLKDGMKLGRTIYSSEGKVLLAAGQEITERYKKKLKDLGIPFVYIEDSRTKDVEILDVVSQQTRTELNSSIKHTMWQMKKKNTLIEVKGIKDIVDGMVDELTSHKNLIINLQDMRSYDDYVYAHAVETCILSVVLGISCKLDPTKLRDLAIGALLHDVGKVKIPLEIINKPDSLTPQEWEVMKKHTVYGFEMLRRNDELSLLSAHVAYQHHERVDSKGYPRGLAGEDILMFAKIVAIADAYDALTCDKIYRKRFLPHEAMEIIKSSAGTQFEVQMVKSFFENIALYPLGTQVELNTGEQGVVVKVEKGFSERPIVRIINDDGDGEVADMQDRNLMEELTVFITKVIE